MDLREAVGKIVKERDDKNVIVSDYDLGYSDGLEFVIKELRSVEGAWVDVSGKPHDGPMCLIEIIEDGCRYCQLTHKPCPCRKSVADHADCPANILKGEG